MSETQNAMNDTAPPEVRLDLQRKARIGIAEAILCANKTVDHLCDIVTKLSHQTDCFLLTRLGPDVFAQFPLAIKERLDYDALSRTALLGPIPTPRASADIVIVAAGTSDASVVHEASRTLRCAGHSATLIFDVGVAGLWRLMEKIEVINAHRVVIAVAGMDAALPTVLGGLTALPLIGVPTSTGYGVSRGGETALNAMLASCSAGISVVNIDNGYGAACAAMRIVAQLDIAWSKARSGSSVHSP
jgi:pyridinium-3,5-biscarboxylic acid mononucleotide synthase